MTSTFAPPGTRRRRRLTTFVAVLALAAGAFAAAPSATASTSAVGGASTFIAWGANNRGQTDLPFDLRSGLKVFNKISLGSSHGLAATTTKKLYAWGDDRFSAGIVPPDLANLGTLDVAAGDLFSVVLGDDGNVRVWGNLASGVGDVPQGAVDATLTRVAAGTDHALALASTGKVWAWGAPGRGQTLIPFALATKTVTAIAAGDGFSMALTDTGRVYAWGDNSSGQSTVPSSLTSTKVVQIAAGAHHALALTEDHQIVAWGDNSEGAGNVPALAPGDQWVQVTAGDGFSSAISKNAATAVVWGRGATGPLSPPANSGSLPTSVVAGGSSVIQGFHRLGVLKAPTVGGTGRMGSTLFPTNAVFGPVDGPTKSGSWITVGGGVISTSSFYTPTIADIGTSVVYRTTATNSVYGTAYSDSPPLLITSALFTSATVPTITGTARVGETLTGSVTSVPAADSYRYDWYADGVYRRTSDASGEYVVQPQDVGKKITLLGNADKAGYERIDAGSSEPTATVEPAPVLTPTAAPKISGTPTVGKVLTVGGATTNPAATTTGYQWLRGGRPISGATSTRYTPTRADSGQQLTAVATLGRPDYAPVTITAARAVRVAPATTALSWKVAQTSRKGSKRPVTVSVVVSAAGGPLTGTVTVRDRAKVVRTVAVRNGRAVVRIKLTKGRHPLRVTYNGRPGVTTATSVKNLVVR